MRENEEGDRRGWEAGSPLGCEGLCRKEGWAEQILDAVQSKEASAKPMGSSWAKVPF